jgi:curved DNA-binding protein CbpA
MATKDPQAKAREERAKIQRFWESIQKQNDFQIFGLDQDADAERLKTAYYTLAKRFHVDSFAGVELGDARETLDAILKRLNDAYDRVTDPKKRAEYLVYLERQRKGLSTDVTAVLQAENLFDQAVAKMRRKDWAGARTDLEEASKLNPDDALMLVNLAWCIYSENRSSKAGAGPALDLLKKATQKQENLAQAYQYMGQIYFDLGKHAEAKSWWNKCLEWEPKNIDASRGLRLLATRTQQKQTGFGGLLSKLFKKK